MIALNQLPSVAAVRAHSRTDMASSCYFRGRRITLMIGPYPPTRCADTYAILPLQIPALRFRHRELVFAYTACQPPDVLFPACCCRSGAPRVLVTTAWEERARTRAVASRDPAFRASPVHERVSVSQCFHSPHGVRGRSCIQTSSPPICDSEQKRS